MQSDQPPRDNDPNEAYSVEPIAEGELMASRGWLVVKRHGEPEWYAPPERARVLATDAAERAKMRRSKMHHDRAPS